MLGMLVVLAAPTFANETKLNAPAATQGFSIYGGWMRHTSSATRAVFGDSGYNVGADYKLQMNNMGNSSYAGETSVGLWFSYHSRNGDTLTSIAPMLWNRIPFSMGSNMGNGVNFYGLTGVGFFFHSAKMAGVTTRATRFGGVLGVGAGMPQGFSVEAGWRWSGSVAGASTDALFVNARFRF